MVHRSRERRSAPPELAPRAVAHLGPSLADLGDGDPAVILVQLGAVVLRVRAAPRVQDVLGEAERRALEPPGHLVDGGGLVHHAGVAAAVDEVAELEEAVPEVGAVVDGVVVELAECLRTWSVLSGSVLQRRVVNIVLDERINDQVSSSLELTGAEPISETKT